MLQHVSVPALALFGDLNAGDNTEQKLKRSAFHLGIESDKDYTRHTLLCVKRKTAITVYVEGTWR